MQIDRNAPDAAWQLETARMSAAAAAPAPAQNPAPANDKNKVNIKKEVKKKPKVCLTIFYIGFHGKYLNKIIFINMSCVDLNISQIMGNNFMDQSCQHFLNVPVYFQQNRLNSNLQTQVVNIFWKLIRYLDIFL